MIPMRYGNLYHGLKLIGFEEGVKGLWRGFGLNCVQGVLRIKLLDLMLRYGKGNDGGKNSY
jgi:hypothetical protein